MTRNIDAKAQCIIEETLTVLHSIASNLERAIEQDNDTLITALLSDASEELSVLTFFGYPVDSEVTALLNAAIELYRS